jgi:hypothetical protein
MLLRNHEEIVELIAVDGRHCTRNDILLWINAIKESPFVRQNDLRNALYSKLPLCVSDTTRQSNRTGIPDSDIDSVHPKLSVAILPKLKTMDFGSEVDKGHIFSNIENELPRMHVSIYINVTVNH